MSHKRRTLKSEMMNLRTPDPNSRTLLLRLRKLNRERFDWRTLIENAIAIPLILAVGGVFFLLPAIGSLRLMGYWPAGWLGVIGLSLAMSVATGLLLVRLTVSPLSARVSRWLGWGAAAIGFFFTLVGFGTLIDPQAHPLSSYRDWIYGIAIAYLTFHVHEYLRLRREEKQRAARQARQS